MIGAWTRVIAVGMNRFEEIWKVKSSIGCSHVLWHHCLLYSLWHPGQPVQAHSCAKSRMEALWWCAAALFSGCANGYHIWRQNSAIIAKLRLQELKTVLPGSLQFSCIQNEAFGRYPCISVSFSQDPPSQHHFSRNTSSSNGSNEGCCSVNQAHYAHTCPVR